MAPVTPLGQPVPLVPDTEISAFAGDRYHTGQASRLVLSPGAMDEQAPALVLQAPRPDAPQPTAWTEGTRLHLLETVGPGASISGLCAPAEPTHIEVLGCYRLDAAGRFNIDATDCPTAESLPVRHGGEGESTISLTGGGRVNLRTAPAAWRDEMCSAEPRMEVDVVDSTQQSRIEASIGPAPWAAYVRSLDGNAEVFFGTPLPEAPQKPPPPAQRPPVPAIVETAPADLGEVPLGAHDLYAKAMDADRDGVVDAVMVWKGKESASDFSVSVGSSSVSHRLGLVDTDVLITSHGKLASAYFVTADDDGRTQDIDGGTLTLRLVPDHNAPADAPRENMHFSYRHPDPEKPQIDIVTSTDPREGVLVLSTTGDQMAPDAVRFVSPVQHKAR